MGFVKVASSGDIPDGEVMAFEVEGKAICVANVEGEFFAFLDQCSHRDFPLSHGEVDPDDCSITCEWHGARFDMKSGKALSLPATRPIPTFACRLDGGDILVDVG